jgi:hypothetical protein
MDSRFRWLNADASRVARSYIRPEETTRVLTSFEDAYPSIHHEDPIIVTSSLIDFLSSRGAILHHTPAPLPPLVVNTYRHRNFITVKRATKATKQKKKKQEEEPVEMEEEEEEEKKNKTKKKKVSKVKPLDDDTLLTAIRSTKVPEDGPFGVNELARVLVKHPSLRPKNPTPDSWTVIARRITALKEFKSGELAAIVSGAPRPKRSKVSMEDEKNNRHQPDVLSFPAAAVAAAAPVRVDSGQLRGADRRAEPHDRLSDGPGRVASDCGGAGPGPSRE